MKYLLILLEHKEQYYPQDVKFNVLTDLVSLKEKFRIKYKLDKSPIHAHYKLLKKERIDD